MGAENLDQGTVVAASREAMGFNQTQMAAAMGVTRGLWLKWERGEQRITAAPVRLLKTLLWVKGQGILEEYLAAVR